MEPSGHAVSLTGYPGKVLLVKFITVGDSDPEARIAWLTSPQGRSKFRRTGVLGGTAAPCWECHDGRETMLGYPAASTTLVPANETMGSGTALTSLILGNMRDVIIHLFSAVDILVNPFTQSVDGSVTISAFQDIDVGFLHAYSFVRMDGIVTT